MRNTPDRFGVVTRFLHWAMALLILILLALGQWIASMEVSLSNLWLFGLHKSLGISVLALALVRIAWHLRTPPPAPIGKDDGWRHFAARIVHFALYILMLAIPLTGWIASSATGIDSVVFQIWTLPAIAPVSETLEKLFFAVHGMLTKLLGALLLLHIAGAVSRRDGTMRRMLFGRA
jgi:cytochrome b561